MIIASVSLRILSLRASRRAPNTKKWIKAWTTTTLIQATVDAHISSIFVHDLSKLWLQFVVFWKIDFVKSLRWILFQWFPPWSSSIWWCCEMSAYKILMVRNAFRSRYFNWEHAFFLVDRQMRDADLAVPDVFRRFVEAFKKVHREQHKNKYFGEFQQWRDYGNMRTPKVE